MNDYINSQRKNFYPQAENIKEYLEKYSQKVHETLLQISQKSLGDTLAHLEVCMKNGKRVYVGGNGGSAAISDHLLCDWMKGTSFSQKPNLKVHSLLDSMALFTATCNDHGYEHALAYPLDIYGEAGDLVVLISSSGNSPNIVKAAETAKKKNITIIALTGFDGGKLRELADISFHIPLHNYGMVEDAHQSIMHVLAQYLYLLREKT